MTDEELEIIGKHTDIGFHIFQLLGLPIHAEVARYHHEQWNGYGLHNLAETGIPLYARLVAIPDTWDSLRFPRPYRTNPVSKNESTKILEDNKGIQFDPNLVDLFLSLDLA